MSGDEVRRPTPRKKAAPSRPARPSRGLGAPASARTTASKAAPAPRTGGGSGSGSGSTPAFLSRASHRGAASSQQAPATSRERRKRHQRIEALRILAIGAGALVAVALALLVAYFVLRDSSMFQITSIEVEPTEHVSVEDVENLAQVPLGSTLLNVDTAAIEASLKKNPWVASVSFERIFPGTLKLVINEQHVDSLVVMGSGSVAWYLGDAGTWIQPTRIEAAEGQSVDDAALALAQAEGYLLITDVPSTVDPKSGSQATDEVLQSVSEFREGFSDELSSKIVCYSASSTEDIWCMLNNGVAVSLGSATDIPEKERIVTEYLEKYPDTALYIVVRVVSNPSVRTIDSETVESAEGSSMFDGLNEGLDANAPTQGEGQVTNEEQGTDGEQGQPQEGDGASDGTVEQDVEGSEGADATGQDGAASDGQGL